MPGAANETAICPCLAGKMPPGSPQGSVRAAFAAFDLRDVQHSLAVPEAVGFDAKLLQHPQVKIAEWRLLGKSLMRIASQASAAAAKHKDWQIVVVVTITIGDTTTVYDQAVVKK